MASLGRQVNTTALSAATCATERATVAPGSRPAAAQTSRVATEDLPDLTRRELEILQLVAEGHSNTQLAKMLWVTEQTVKFHLSNIYRKLDVPNRTAASAKANSLGLLERVDGDGTVPSTWTGAAG